MGLSIAPKHLDRYASLARLLARHGRRDLVERAGMATLLEAEMAEGSPADEAELRERAESLADDLEALGPTYIKLGQLLSSRVDLLPPPYLKSLARLQDRVEPFPYEDVERIVSEELGVRLSKAFAEFDVKPVAAASLAQVHRATLRDGRRVAVKVQRPGIRQRVQDDLEALTELAEFVDEHSRTAHRYRLADVLAQFRQSLLRELDFRNEARNLETLAENMSPIEAILVPRPVEDYSTSRVLTMDLVQGRKITALSPVALLEIDRNRLADQLFRAYLKQIVVDGFFHADPHPGNVFITDDGRVALLDLGMVSMIGPDSRERLLRLLLALADSQADEAASILLDLGEPEEDADTEGFIAAVSEVVLRTEGKKANEIALGVLVLELVRLLGRHGVSPAPQLSMLGKTLFNLDQVGRALDPDLDPNAAIRRHATELMERRMMDSLSPSRLLQAAMETNELVQRMPQRMNRILDLISENRLSLDVDAIDETRLISGLEKIANRITLGLIIAAMIMGAAMLVSVDGGPRLMGYPALSLVLFLMAAVAGVALALQIVLKDD